MPDEISNRFKRAFGKHIVCNLYERKDGSMCASFENKDDGEVLIDSDIYTIKGKPDDFLERKGNSFSEHEFSMIKFFDNFAILDDTIKEIIIIDNEVVPRYDI